LVIKNGSNPKIGTIGDLAGERKRAGAGWRKARDGVE
jgi:hypothetical protein